LNGSGMGIKWISSNIFDFRLDLSAAYTRQLVI